MLRAQMILFSIAGTIGFVVDTAVLYAALWAGADPYSGRLVSVTVAVTVTWYLNRRFTFASTDARLIRQWFRFVCVNISGLALNLAVYAVLISVSTAVADQPILGVAAGALAGMVSNFLLSRAMVFR